jgi:pimeloyl-ACP methyl ester carboxylesterase
MVVALYAMKYPDHVKGIVQIAPIQPDSDKQYPEHLTGADATYKTIISQLAELGKQKRPEDPEEACKQFWNILLKLNVADPADVDKIVNWGRCELPNEQNFMKYWKETILPSIQTIHLNSEQLVAVKTRFLIIHGRKDRNAPYGGGRDWALMLPNARLLTVENAAHAPWIEDPKPVFNAINEFLNGKWPQSSEKVKSLEPQR